MIVRRRGRMIGEGGDCDCWLFWFVFGYKVGVWIDMDWGVYNVLLLNGCTFVCVSFCQLMVGDATL